MLFYFITSSFCWSPQMLAIAFEIGMKPFSDEYRNRMLNTFRVSGDDFERAAEGIQWLYNVEKPPFNIPSFNHWHFDYFSYNPEQLEITENSYTDNLYYNLGQTQAHLFAADSTKPWPFSFNLKHFLTSVCDAHSIFHASELFSSEFPKGDNHGKKFMISYNGKTKSILDFWEEGCGDFTQLNWNDVNDTANKIMKEFPTNPYNQTEISWSSVMKETREITKKFGYSDLSNNQKLTENYVEKCKEISRQQIAKAGYALQISLKRIAINQYQLPPLSIKGRKTETFAWSLLALLLPIVIFVFSRTHFRNQK
ncbi:hypothetical protein TRFO_06727 [Tritrichomonas foetus]|uniref:Uncharacterized protein n=1 Tax=Tritrichomonas foetus TaxID=1144522 RepID=A0A1J4JWT7_9EUKA|nr:hypothetical protein TRFO_06727 [Tritrichomonas foetus]|eukprot:OHT03467.1 hypothetical protein TRFO_06727 [Tritrichomonas foetus]